METITNLSLSRFVIKVFLVGLSRVLKVDLFLFWFGRSFPMKKDKKPRLCTSPILLRLGEGRFA